MPYDKYFKTKHQISTLIKTHLITCTVMIFLTVAMLTMDGNPTAKYILTSLCAFSAFLSMFSNCFDIAEKDANPNIQRKSYPLKGLVLSIGIIGLVLFSFVCYKAAWAFFPQQATPGAGISAPCLICQLIYIFLTSPFYAFVNIVGSNSSITGLIAYIIFIAVSCELGYFCGYKRIDFLLHIRKFMFEKKK